MLATTNGPQFRYTLRSELLGKLRLRHEPTDWDQLALALHRDLKTHGVATEYTTKLGFIKDGAAYLRRAYAAAGVEARVYLLIEQLLPNEFTWQPYYQGRVDFTAAEFTALRVTVGVEPDSWLQKFLSRDSISVDLFGATSVSGAASPAVAPRTVQLHSRAILQRYSAKQKNPATTQATMYGDENDDSHEQTLYFGFDTPLLNELSLGAVAGGWTDGSAATAVPIHTADADGEYIIELALFADIKAENDAGPHFEKVDGVCHFRINGDPTTAVRLQPDVSASVDGYYQGTINVPARTFTVQLQKGDGIYLYADYFVHEIGGAGAGIRYRATISATLKPGSYLRISAKTITEPTPAAGLLLYEAFERTVQALTDEVDVFRSDYLGRPDCSIPYPADGPGALTLLTGGFQVRGFPLPRDPAPAADEPDPRKSLYTTWRELFEACAAVYGLGWGTEWVINRAGRLAQVVRVEPLSYWYRDEVVLDLTAAGPQTDTVRVSAADHYQVVEIDYTQWQAQQANGLDEFNSKRQWTTPLTTVKSTYKASSALSTSGILLETTRRDRYDATATTDTSRDATNFLVCLLRTAAGLETERNQRATRLDGVLSPATVYNLRLSPARILRRHGVALASGMLPAPGALVRFTSGEGNTTMVSQLVGEPAAIGEGGDLLVSELPAAWWRPERTSFRCPVGRAGLHALLAQPAGRVRYLNQDGRMREGWVVDCTHTATEGTADFMLLPCAL